LGEIKNVHVLQFLSQRQFLVNSSPNDNKSDSQPASSKFTTSHVSERQKELTSLTRWYPQIKVISEDSQQDETLEATLFSQDIYLQNNA
jgi:hypothetical protein